MSKYEDIKARIQALDDGWNREADDIICEVSNNNKQAARILINNYHSDSSGAEIEVYLNWSTGGANFKTFKYTTQCLKMLAFKKALLWLLDHSDIKKDEKQDKIKEFEGELNTLKEKIQHLKKEM